MTLRDKISQAEIDALLAGLQGDATAQANADTGDDLESPGEALPFYIPAQDHLHRGLWPGLQAINQRFARRAPQALVGLFQNASNPRGNAAGSGSSALSMQSGLESQTHFGAFLKQLPEPSHCHLMSIEPLDGWGLIAFEARLTLAASASRFATADTPMAQDAVAQMPAADLARAGLVLELIASEYNRAWHDFYPLNMQPDRILAQARLGHVAPLRERVVASSFELSVGDLSAHIHICFPHASLAPLQTLLKSTTHGHLPQPNPYWRSQLTEEMASVELTLSAKLARFDMTVAALLSMQAGDVLPFVPRPTVEATVDGVPLFACEYGSVNGKNALRIQKNLRGEVQTIVPNSGGQHGN